MEAIRRVDFYFCIGYRYFLGTLDYVLLFMIVTPLFILWFMSWMRSVIHVHVNNSKQDTFIVSSLNK